MDEPTGVCDFCGRATRRRGRTGPFPRYCGKPCQQRAGRRRRGEVPTEPRTCTGCGASLAGFQANRRTCSRRCHHWVKRNPGAPHPSAAKRACARCGIPINDRDVRSAFCSNTCRDREYAGCVVNEQRLCGFCGQMFLTLRKTSQFCGRECSAAAEYAANKADYLRRAKADRARRRGARVETFPHEEVFERDGWVCYLCNELVDREAIWPAPLMPSLDHVVPISRGGEHSRANTRCAHLVCNLRKGDRLLDEVA